MYTLSVPTQTRTEWIDITARVAELVAKGSPTTGAVLVYVPHTTCGCTINEHADPDVVADITRYLDRLVPRDGGFQHTEGDSDAHIKTLFVGTSVTVPVENGRMALGTWQGIFVCEFDGPRQRRVLVRLLDAC